MDIIQKVKKEGGNSFTLTRYKNDLKVPTPSNELDTKVTIHIYNLSAKCTNLLKGTLYASDF